MTPAPTRPDPGLQAELPYFRTHKRRQRLRLALALVLFTVAVGLVFAMGAAHASPPDCTDADRSQGSGIEVANGRATFSFTLERDCGIGLTSYEVRGNEQVKYDTQSANTAGRHTLSVAVPPCYQVDAHNGEVHNRGEGKAIRYVKKVSECETSPTTTSATIPPSPSTTSTTPSTSSTVPAASSTTIVPCVPDCENPDAPEHVPPELAYGGYDAGDAVPWALAVIAGVLLVGASRLWEEEG